MELANNTKRGIIISRVLFPAFVGLWPVLYSFVEIDALSFYKDTSQFLIDPRLLFYSAFFLFLFLRAAKGFSRQVLLSLLPIAVWGIAYLLSFLFNTNNESDYKQFLNGFFLFSVLYTYVAMYRNSMNWGAVVTAYSLSFIIITLFGFYSFSRFEGGLNLMSGGLSHQMWRLCGGKTIYIPAALILYALFFQYKDQGKSNLVMNVAVILSLISVALSGQRTAIVVLLYFGSMFFVCRRLVAVLVAVAMLCLALLLYRENIQMFLQVTFERKLHDVALEGALTRIDIWAAALDVLVSKAKYFLLGVSEGGLPSAYGDSWPIASNNPHSVFLYFWASTGLLGVAVLVAVICFFGVRLHMEKKPYKMLFYWILTLYFLFAGFGFYTDSVRSDFLNIGIVIVVFYFSTEKYPLRVRLRVIS